MFKFASEVIFSDMLQDGEYVKTADKAWHDALEIAKSKEGWKVEKEDKELVSRVANTRKH